MPGRMGGIHRALGFGRVRDSGGEVPPGADKGGIRCPFGVLESTFANGGGGQQCRIA